MTSKRCGRLNILCSKVPLRETGLNGQEETLIKNVLNISGEVYLDHAGTTLYSSSLIREYLAELSGNLYGNPHSESRSSRLSTARVQETREHVLQFFHADPEQFDVVFVLNATSAIKLVAETLTSLQTGSSNRPLWYGYHIDSHTSVVGLRQLASAGYRCFESNDAVDHWLETGSHIGEDKSIRSSPSTTEKPPIGLFAYPGQSNMTGHRLPLSWPGRLRRSNITANQEMYSLLDAAALASTAPLDFSDPSEAADFTAISFYKIFGFPDLGGLIIRKDAAHIFQERLYFGGGTVDMVICNGDPWHSMKSSSVHAALEDGTVPFHNIIALDCALTNHKHLYGGMEQVSRHTSRLTAMLYHGLSSLRHQNGKKACQIYKDHSSSHGDSRTQGAVIAFNIRSEDGTWVMLSDLEAAANEHHIHLRTGDVCNPGGIARHLELAPWELLRNFMGGVRCGCKNIIIGHKPSGIARVSLGAMTNVQDVETFVNFVQQTFVSSLSLYIQNILVYPIRGCSAWWIADTTPVNLTSNGLHWDGQWCLVDLQHGTILTPKTAPRALLVHPEIDSDSHTLRIKVHRSLWTYPMIHSNVVVHMDREVSDLGHTSSKKDIHMFWDEDTGTSVQLLLYRELEVQTFLTAALGIHCTLARIVDKEPRDDDNETTPNNLDALTIMDQSHQSNDSGLTNGSHKLNDYDLSNHPPQVIGSQRPRQVSVAETLGANIVLAPVCTKGYTHQIGRHYFAYIGQRRQEANEVEEEGVRQTYHLAQIRESELSTQGKLPNEFRASCVTKKLLSNAMNRSDKIAYPQIHTGQIVLA